MSTQQVMTGPDHCLSVCFCESALCQHLLQTVLLCLVTHMCFPLQRSLGSYATEAKAEEAQRNAAIRTGHPTAKLYCDSNPFEGHFVSLYKVRSADAH